MVFDFLYPEHMEKVRIIVPYGLRHALMDSLHSLNIIDLRESHLKLSGVAPPEYYTQLNDLYTKTGELLGLLPPTRIIKEKKMKPEELIRNALLEVNSLGDVWEVSGEQKVLQEEEKALDYIESKNKLEKKMRKTANKLEGISEKHYSRLINIHEMIKIELDKLNAYAFLKKTENTAIIEGWVPKKRLGELRAALRKTTSGLYTIESVGTVELPPTYIKSTGILGSFNYVVNLFSAPRSDEINPAWFLLFSFPILYGLMVSDVGYGLLSLLMALAIVKFTHRKSLYHNLANVWILSSIFTVFFGILNNQYFGMQLDQQIFPFFSGFDWKSNLLTVVAISIIVGVFEISVGTILGIVNAYNNDDKRLMLFKFFLLTALISGTLLVSSAFGIVSSAIASYSALALLVSIFSMILSRPSSSARLLDLITYPLSYVRLMGFGVASIILASLIDNAFTPNPSSGVVIFAIYVVIYVLLHLLNMALSTFEAGIQSFRLNFIEFFDQFYTGKGVKYNPFGYERVYTLE